MFLAVWGRVLPIHTDARMQRSYHVGMQPRGENGSGIKRCQSSVATHLNRENVQLEVVCSGQDIDIDIEVAQSCPTLCDPMDCSLPGSSVHGIFQARVLEWGAIAFSACVCCHPST